MVGRMQNEAKTATLSVRVSGTELDALDALAEELSEAARGMRVSRSDAVHVAIEHGLRALAAEKKKR